jgi:hypothetical protein
VIPLVRIHCKGCEREAGRVVRIDGDLVLSYRDRGFAFVDSAAWMAANFDRARRGEALDGLPDESPERTDGTAVRRLRDPFLHGEDLHRWQHRCGRWVLLRNARLVVPLRSGRPAKLTL